LRATSSFLWELFQVLSPSPGNCSVKFAVMKLKRTLTASKNDLDQVAELVVQRAKIEFPRKTKLKG
jgi:hypothetical protein